MTTHHEYIEPGLYLLTRPTDVKIWMACHNQITLLSYSEKTARDWLAREREYGGLPPDAA